jgi:O-antigen/teichoic acid export membrane protein
MAVASLAARLRSAPTTDLHVLARGSVATLTGGIVYGLSGFLFAVAATRALGADGAGVLFEAIALLTIGTTVALLGTDAGVIWAIPRYRAHNRSQDVARTLALALVPVAAVGLAFAALIAIAAPQIADVLFGGVHEDEAVPYLRLLAPFLPLLAASRLLASATRGYGRILPYVLIENAGKGVVRVLLALVAVAVGAGQLGFVSAWAVPILLGFAATATVLHRIVAADRVDPAAPRAEKRALAREFWGFTAPRSVQAFFSVTILWLDILLVGSLASTREAGIYAAATRYVTVSMLVLQMLFAALGPQVSDLIARDRIDRVETTYRTATIWVTALAWPLYVAIVSFAPTFLAVFGPEFVAGEDALVILAGASLVNLATGPGALVLLMSGRSRLLLANAVVSLAMNVTLNFVLIPALGITGAAIALGASVLFNSIAPLAQARYLLGIHPFTRGLALVATASVSLYGGLGIAFRVALGDSLPVLGVFVLAATALYLVFLWRFRDALELTTIGDALGLSRRRVEVAPAAPSGGA